MASVREEKALLVSSVSSVSSGGSTRELLRSLSKEVLVENQENKDPVPLPSPTLSADKPKPVKKPIKFTVRKVSHEPIKSPVLENSNVANKQLYPGILSFHNTDPQHKPHATSVTLNNADTREEDKLRRVHLQLSQTQAKYNLYEARMIKIHKEIDFLTNLLPPYNVEIDYATRTKITRAIEKLKTKQDEIEKKKYSLGISISRLSRELDDSDIWVRSVSKQ